MFVEYHFRSGRLSFEYVFRDDGSTVDRRGKWKHRHSLNLAHDHVNVDPLLCTWNHGRLTAENKNQGRIILCLCTFKYDEEKEKFFRGRRGPQKLKSLGRDINALPFLTSTRHFLRSSMQRDETPWHFLDVFRQISTLKYDNYFLLVNLT
jgi:hypothetical protein